MNSPLASVDSDATTAPPSFVDWGAIFAGGIFAAALSFILLAFGAAVGFSMTSPWENSGASSRTVASVAVVWTIATQIGALLAGGYIAGRMRGRWMNANSDEVDFRDGVHGGMVWAVCVVIGAIMTISAAGGILRMGGEAAGRVASSAAANADPIATNIDTLLRPATNTAMAKTPAGTSSPTAAGTANDAPVSPEQRAELVRIFTRSAAAGTISTEDRNYVSSIVAQRTGLPQQEAEQRVTNAYNQASAAVKNAADTARKSAAVAGFVTAASLILSLGAAWWAATRGGNHRDNSIPARFSFSHRTS